MGFALSYIHRRLISVGSEQKLHQSIGEAFFPVKLEKQVKQILHSLPTATSSDEIPAAGIATWGSSTGRQ